MVIRMATEKETWMDIDIDHDMCLQGEATRTQSSSTKSIHGVLGLDLQNAYDTDASERARTPNQHVLQASGHIPRIHQCKMWFSGWDDVPDNQLSM